MLSTFQVIKALEANSFEQIAKGNEYAIISSIDEHIIIAYLVNVNSLFFA